jgi:hypothetical protein
MGEAGQLDARDWEGQLRALAGNKAGAPVLSPKELGGSRVSVICAKRERSQRDSFPVKTSSPSQLARTDWQGLEEDIALLVWETPLLQTLHHLRPSLPKHPPACINPSLASTYRHIHPTTAVCPSREPVFGLVLRIDNLRPSRVSQLQFRSCLSAPLHRHFTQRGRALPAALASYAIF